MRNVKIINLAVSAHGYGAEEAFDFRAQQTGYTVVKPSTGDEFLSILQSFSNSGLINDVKIFSHSYPRGIIMSNWSGFYKSPGPQDTPKAAYVKELAQRVSKGEIRFSSNARIVLFGCNTINESFTQALSRAIRGSVIGAEGGVYPEIINGKETGVFITTHRWVKYNNGSVVNSNMGKRLTAW